MKAIVLVGGEGTRLRPLTSITPKPLLPIANQPHLERQLQWLASAGITEVVLSLGYLPDAFLEHFPSGEFMGMQLRYAVEDSPLGTAGAIRFAAGNVDERVVVCNGDVLTTLDLRSLIAFHEARNAEATIALTRVADPSAFGVVPTNADGAVMAFVEKPPAGKAPTDWINAGTYVLEPAALKRIPTGLQVSIERETFPRMLEEPNTLFAMHSDAYWIDIGTPDKYIRAHLDVIGGQLTRTPIEGALEHGPGVWLQGDALVHPMAHVEPPVLLGDGVEICEGARVEASVLGPNVFIGANARVRRSVLLAGARVAPDAEINDSILGPGAQLGGNVLLTDHTIVGAQAAVAAGTQLAGARIDS